MHHPTRSTASRDSVINCRIEKANDQAEHFEREWYLRGDEIERMKAAQPAPVQSEKRGEPVATVKAKRDGSGGTFVHWTTLPVAGMKLYTSPSRLRHWHSRPAKAKKDLT